MKIAMLAPRYPPEMDGVGDHAAKLAGALRRLGHDPVVLTTGESRTQSEVDVRVVGKTWSISTALRSARVIRRCGADALVVEYTPFLFGARSLAPLIVPRACGLPTFAFVHEIFYGREAPAVKSRAKELAFEARDRAVLASCDGVFIPNVAKGERIVAKMGDAYRRKMTIVPIGSNLEPVGERVWSADSRDGRRKRIVAFGVVAGRRRIERAIDALAILTSRNVDAELRVVGRIWDRGYAAACRERAHAAGVGERVTFVENLSEAAIGDEFFRADAVAYMAEEGLTSSAGSLLAAFAHGAPVVATRNSRDESRLTAVVTLADDAPEDFARALSDVLDGPDRIAALAASSVALYRSAFGWDSSAAAIVSRLALKRG